MNKTRVILAISTVVASGVFVEMGFAGQAWAEEGCDGLSLEQPVIALGDSQVTGNATLCVGKNGIRGEMDTQNLRPGFAYTIWWVYIDHPEECVVPGCGEPDFLGDDPLGVFGRMDSLVAPKSGEGFFSDKVHNQRLSSGSLVWLIAHVHGRASTDDNRFLARQLLTPQDPIFGAPASGAAADGIVGVPNFIAVFNIP